MSISVDWNGYEVVSSIQKNGFTYELNEMMSCDCQYQVVKIQPVWHSETKKHWADHKMNSFLHVRTFNPSCKPHSQERP